MRRPTRLQYNDQPVRHSCVPLEEVCVGQEGQDSLCSVQCPVMVVVVVMICSMFSALHVVVQWAPSWWWEAENWAAPCGLLSLFAPFFTSVSVTMTRLSHSHFIVKVVSK